MNKNDPEARLKDLELEVRELDSQESEESLRKEMSFRQAIERAIPSGIAVIDDTGKQVYVNQSFCKMFGWSEEELLGKHPPYAYWHPKDMENINKALSKTLKSTAPEEVFDLIFRHKSGNSIAVHVIISPFKQDDDKTFFLANVIDITERKNTEEALKRSQLLLASSIESQKDTIIFSIDNDYNYLFYNRAHLDSMRFAYKSDIEIGKNILDCISSDDDRKMAKENYDRALSGESFTSVQAFGDVHKAYYESFFNPIMSENYEIIGCTGLARNITERIEVEQALKESETKFKEIIDQINDALIVFDEQGRIVIWNKGAENICGVKASEVLNSNIVDIQYQFTPPPFNDKGLIENVINGIVTMQTPEIFNQIIDSELITLNSEYIRNIQSCVFPIKLNGYNLFCTVIRDTTEIKRYEKELMRISADKDKFYSIIAQYLYNPFNLFHDFAKTMAEELDTLSIKEIQKMVLMMSKSASNLYSLLDNMLQWTRLNQGKITCVPQKLIFQNICREAVSILKPNASAKNITINHTFREEIIVFADVFMSKTILRNLVSYAIDFTSESGHIDISAQQTATDVIISVSLTGIEITPKYLNKLFDISEIHTSLGLSEEKGTTLGLLLCKEFVGKHGGKIWVDSDKGKVSEVKFTLPVFSNQPKDSNT